MLLPLSGTKSSYKDALQRFSMDKDPFRIVLIASWESSYTIQSTNLKQPGPSQNQLLSFQKQHDQIRRLQSIPTLRCGDILFNTWSTFMIPCFKAKTCTGKWEEVCTTFGFTAFLRLMSGRRSLLSSVYQDSSSIVSVTAPKAVLNFETHIFACKVSKTVYCKLDEHVNLLDPQAIAGIKHGTVLCPALWTYIHDD